MAENRLRIGIDAVENGHIPSEVLERSRRSSGTNRLVAMIIDSDSGGRQDRCFEKWLRDNPLPVQRNKALS